MIIQLSREDCPNCEEVFSHLLDAGEDFKEGLTRNGEVQCFASAMTTMLATYCAQTDTEEDLEFPFVLLTGKDALRVAKLAADAPDEEEQCQDGVCKIGPLTVSWDFGGE